MRWLGLAIGLALIALLWLFLSREHARVHRAAAGAVADGVARRAAETGEAANPAVEADSAVDAPRRPETFEVEVVSEGRLIEGARVEVWEGERLATAATTDRRGLASLTANRAGGTRLVACRRGFVPAAHWLYEDEHETPTIHLTPGLPVNGLVTLADAGRPAAGAEVHVRWDVFAYVDTRADALGRFEIPGVEPSTSIRVTATLEGYEAVKVDYTEDPAAPQVEVVLGRGGTCEGRVVDEAGQPVPDATVSVRQSGRPWVAMETRTDAEGRFTARGLEESEERRAIATTADHRSGESAPFACSPESPVHRCDIVVRPYPRVSVAVSLPDGTPAAKAAVVISTLGPVATTDRCAQVAGTQGLFESGPIMPGESEIRVIVPGWAFQTRQIRVSPAACTRVEFRLDEGLRVEGVVVDREGRLLRGVSVGLERPGTDEDRVQIAETTTGADGGFRLRGLAEEEATLFVASGDTRYLPVTMAARPGQPPIRVVLDRRPRIIGRLDPVPDPRGLGASLGWGLDWRWEDVWVGRDGRFEIRRIDIPAGQEFWLRLEAEGRLPWVFVGLRLAPDETLDLGILRPAEGVAIEGVVSDPGGKPLANVDVVAFSEIDDLNVSGGACTDAEGRFSIADLADVPLEIRAEAEGYVPKELKVARGAARLTVVLEPGGVLEIRGANGDVEVEPVGSGERAAVVSPGGGRAELTLAPGRYRVGDRVVEIRAGETTRVDLGD